MLDWLKKILGDTYTEEIDKAVSKKIGEDFVSRTDFNTKNTALKTLEGQLKDRDTQLEELKKVDTKALEDEITRLQQSNLKSKQEYDSKLAQMRLSSAIDSAILSHHGKNTRAIKSLIDLSKIKQKGDGYEGIEEQIEEVKKSDDYLFTKVETSQEGTEGGSHSGAGTENDTPPEDFASYEIWRAKH